MCARAGRSFSTASLDVGSPSDDAPDHVVLVVVDGLRYDYVTDSPLREPFDLVEGVAPSTWTFPAVTSLLTGVYPHEHGAMRRTDEADNHHKDGLVLPDTVDEEVPTLSRILAAAGYETYGGFGFYMPFVALFGQFERNELYNDGSAGSVLSDHAEWLQQNRTGRTFSYLHLADLHEPVDPPGSYWDTHDIDRSIPDIRSWDYVESADVDAEGQRYRDHKVRLYEAALDYLTDELDSYLDRVQEIVADDPLVVVTADHGEAFWEMAAFDEANFYDDRPAYGVGHGGTPYESIAKVPILVNRELGTASELRSTVDIVPTILERVGIDSIEDLSGSSLFSDSTTSSPLVEASRYGYEKKATYRDGVKHIVSKSDDVAVTFALPEEEPVAVSAAADSDVLDELPDWPDDAGSVTEVSRRVEKRLDRLGYK